MLDKNVIIAGLIVGKRHCRVLTLGNINSDATGFDIIHLSFLDTLRPLRFNPSETSVNDIIGHWSLVIGNTKSGESHPLYDSAVETATAQTKSAFAD